MTREEIATRAQAVAKQLRAEGKAVSLLFEVDADQAARIWGCSWQTLKRRREEGLLPRYYFDGKSISYRIDHLIEDKERTLVDPEVIKTAQNRPSRSGPLIGQRGHLVHGKR